MRIQHHEKTVKRVLICVFGVLICFIGTFFLFFGFRITNIYIEGEHVAFDIDESHITRNLLFFPIDKVRDALLRDSPMAKDIQIQKIFPSTLKFIVTQRVPKARLFTREQSLLIDDEGHTLGVPTKKDDALVPLYVDIPMQTIGVKVSSDAVLRALLILKLFPVEYSIKKIEAIEMQSLRVEIAQSDILFPQDGDIEEHIRTLQTLFTGFRIKGALPPHIDLRFEKPIVR